ncbi:hypothetical protein VTI74DRAFT_1368 [Chaetomium olivicolor]
MSSHRVFVTAATGTQGSAVCRQLRALGWEVNTTTRNPSSPAAQALTSIGVHVHPGDWSDTAAISAALSGCDLLFLNVMPDLSNVATETEHAATILRMARAAGVQQVVYSGSVDLRGASDDPMHIINIALGGKRSNEASVQSSGIARWTILRPGNFMANFLSPKAEFVYPGVTETGVIRLAFRPETELPMIDHEDIAAFAVAAFRDPERFHGQVIDLIGEYVRVDRLLEIIRKAAGKDIRVVYLKDEEIEEEKKKNPLIVVQEVLRDIPLLEVTDGRKWGVEMGTFEKFAEREKKEFEETYRRVGV